MKTLRIAVVLALVTTPIHSAFAFPLGSARAQDGALVAHATRTASQVVAPAAAHPSSRTALDRARALTFRTQELAESLTRRLSVARSLDDRALTRCLDDTLAQVNAHARWLAPLYVRLRAAQERDDAAETDRLLGAWRIATDRLSELRVRAISCEGGGTVHEGTVEVEVLRSR